MTDSNETAGLWAAGPSRLWIALEKAEAEEVESLEAEMQDADEVRQAELEREILVVRARYREKREQGAVSLF